jgi:hypothetical protein
LVLNFERPFYAPEDRSETTPTQNKTDQYAYNLHMRRDSFVNMRFIIAIGEIRVIIATIWQAFTRCINVHYVVSQVGVNSNLFQCIVPILRLLIF